MIKRLASIEIKFFRRTARYTFFDHKGNEEILEEFKVQPADEKLRRYKSNRLRHVTRMHNKNKNNNNNRTPKIILSSRPNERRRRGRPLKRILDEAETGLSGHNS
jgi:hypothetical protein